jgi:hypothetical protein
MRPWNLGLDPLEAFLLGLLGNLMVSMLGLPSNLLVPSSYN